MRNDYLIIGTDYDDDYLAHYGVLGMKWHHHQAVKYSSKAARASNAARNEQKYRKDFDKDMKRRMNKNDPNDVRTWQNTRNAEHEASKFNEQSYRDRAKKYYKKANEHLDKNRRAQDEYRNIAKTEAERIAKMYKDGSRFKRIDENYRVIGNDGQAAITSRGASAVRKINKTNVYTSVTDKQMANHERNKRGHAALIGTVAVAAGISGLNAKRQRKKGM